MSQALYIATGNPGKLKELIQITQEFFPEFESIQGMAPLDAVEDAPDYIGNAKIKAHALVKQLIEKKEKKFWVLADDSGLSVDALDGAPGVHSARYAGDHVDPQEHIQKLLGELKNKNLDGSTAHYHCALCLLFCDNGAVVKEFVSEGQCLGEIVFEQKGLSGFGYDPVFFVPELKKNMAELSDETKNQISHRRRSFEKLQVVADTSQH